MAKECVDSAEERSPSKISLIIENNLYSMVGCFVLRAYQTFSGHLRPN